MVILISQMQVICQRDRRCTSKRSIEMDKKVWHAETPLSTSIDDMIGIYHSL